LICRAHLTLFEPAFSGVLRLAISFLRGNSSAKTDFIDPWEDGRFFYGFFIPFAKFCNAIGTITYEILNLESAIRTRFEVAEQLSGALCHKSPERRQFAAAIRRWGFETALVLGLL
jgi:hypothetical protein